MRLSRWRLAVGIGAFALVTFLFFKSRSVDLQEHNRFNESLLRLSQVDSELGQDFLKIAYALQPNYDRINRGFSNLKHLRGRLHSIPSFVDERRRQEMAELLNQFDSALKQKEALFRDFQSSNVRLKNSLAYLPILSTELAEMAADSPSDRSLALDLRDLLRDVLLYCLSSQEQLRPLIRERMARIEQRPRGRGRQVGKRDLALVAGHVRSILNYKPKVDSLTSELVSTPTGEVTQRLLQLYDQSYEGALMEAETYQAYLYFFSISLLVYIFYTIYKLWQITRELNVINENLEERVRDRTRALAKSQARNRALLNAIPDTMIRIRRNGTVLDVKQSAMVPLEVTPEQLGQVRLKDVWPELASQAMEPIQEAVDSGEAHSFHFESSKDGDPVDFEVRVVLVSRSQALVIVRDVTEQRRATEKVERAQRRSEQLLHNILPIEVAEELKKKGQVDPKYFEDVTILSSDFIGFSQSTERLAVEELVHILQEYFTDFDEITERYGLEKLNTIGDTYICVGGLPQRKSSHPVDTVLAALEMIESVRLRRQKGSPVDWTVRIGIHTGPVVAGVVGIRKFAFDIWGQTVALVSRIHSMGQADRALLSGDTFSRVKDFFQIQNHRQLKTHERDLETYFVQGVLPSLMSDPKGKLPPPGFVKRYRIYFQGDPPSFPGAPLSQLLRFPFAG